MTATYPVFLALILAVGACDDGLDGSKPVSSLNDSDKGQFCDWANNLYFGYDIGILCNGESVDHTDYYRAMCVQAFASCSATVAEFQTCIKMIAATPCVADAVATARASPECQASTGCLDDTLTPWSH